METLPERIPDNGDLLAARDGARRLLMMSRGIHILLGGLLLMLAGGLKAARFAEPVSREYVDLLLNDLLLPIGALLVVVVDALLLRWRRESGAIVGDWGQPPHPAGASAHLRWRWGLLKSTGLLLIIPLATFLFVGSADPAHPDRAINWFFGIFALEAVICFLWRWCSLNLWQTWVLWSGVLSGGASLLWLGLDHGMGWAMLIAGMCGTLSGLFLEASWVRWLKMTRMNLDSASAPGGQL